MRRIVKFTYTFNRSPRRPEHILNSEFKKHRFFASKLCAQEKRHVTYFLVNGPFTLPPTQLSVARTGPN